MFRKITPALIAFFLLLSAAGCAKRADQPQDPGVSTVSTETLPEGEQAESPQVVETESVPFDYGELFITTIPDIPVVSIFEVEPDVVSPGEEMWVSGHVNLSGTLEITGAAGEAFSAPLVNGTATFTIPDTWADGYAVIQLSDVQGTLGFAGFRIASQGGIWLSANRSFISNDADTMLRIRTAGLPEDALGAVYVKAQPDGPAVSFIPDEHGVLLPGVSVPIQSLVGRDLRLSSADQGEVFVQAEPANMLLLEPGEGESQDSPLFEGWVSNSLQIQPCDAGGSISGSLGAAGYANAVWLDGGIRSASIYSADGAFALDAGPGRVMLQTITAPVEDSPVIQTTFLEVGCAEQITVSIQHPGTRQLAAGSLSGGSDIAAQSGGSEICRSGIITARVSKDGEDNQELALLASVALKTAITRSSPAANIITFADVQSLIQAAGEAMLLGDDEAADEAMEVLRAAVSTDFLINLNAAKLGETYHLAIASLPLNSSDVQVRASGQGAAGALTGSSFEVYTRLAEDFSHAAICGSVEPEKKVVSPGESLELTYTVTDLSGAGAEGASVAISTPACGTLDPDNGVVQESLFQSTYTMPENEFCVEELEFNAEWDGPAGSVKTKEQEAIAHLSPLLPDISLQVGGATGLGTDFNIVSAVTLLEDYAVKKGPGEVPVFSAEGECGFLAGGLDLFDQGYFVRAEQSGKRAEAKFSVFPFTDLNRRISHPDAGPVDHFAISMQMDSLAFPIGDTYTIRGAWASAGTSNTIFAEEDMQLPGTVYVFDIHNPGRLPVVPIISWNVRTTVDKSGGYAAFAFYKLIRCGDAAGLDSMEGFYSGGNMLFSHYSDEPGEPSGLETLPRLEDERTQIILYITANTEAASLRDDSDGIYLSGFSRMQINLDVYLSQEIVNSEE